jgi:hypothetical protein
LRWTVLIAVVTVAGLRVVVTMARSMIRVMRIVAWLIGGGSGSGRRCRVGWSRSFNGAAWDPNTLVKGGGGIGAPTAWTHSDWSFKRGPRRNCG